MLTYSFELCIFLLRVHYNYNYNTSKGEIYHAKFLKKEHRKKAVIKKVRQFQKENVDFSIADKKKQEEWEKCKEIVRRMGYEFQFGRYIWYNWFHVWMRSQYSVFGLEVWQRVESEVQLKIQL